MYLAAIRGELFRMVRNRRLLLLAYGPVPLFFFIFGSGIDMTLRFDGESSGRALEASQMMRALAAAGNPIACLFFLVGAASLYADDYRWETWRLIVPRNSRTRLIISKFLCFVLFAAISLALAILLDRLVSIVRVVIAGTGGPGAADLGWLVVAFLGSLLELAVAGAIACLGALVTRSLIGGLLPAFLFSMFQAIALVYISPPVDRLEALIAPAQAGYVLRLWAGPVRGLGTVDAHTAAVAVASLLVWLILCLGVAILILRNQDLSRE